MAFRDLTRGIKNFFGPNNRFFNGEREADASADAYYGQQEPQSYAPETPYGAPQPTYQQPQDIYNSQQPPYQQAQPQPYYQQAQPQQNYQQAQPQQNYQQPYPQQQPYRGGYQQQPQQPQQPYAGGFQQQTVDQVYVPPRNRRSSQHTQAQENVVPFPGMNAAPQQPMMGQQPAAAPQPQANEQKTPKACVLNVRNIADCRSAIGILRAGDCVIAVIDSIADQSEVRRYVDTLNGACFSLGCSMTRTSSRVGVYFLAPQGMQVLTDQVTTQMNNQSRAPQRPRSGQPIFQTAAAASQTYAQRPAYGQYAAPQQSVYAQPPQQPSYAQQPQPSFTAQEPVQGYDMPDQDAQEYAQDAIN